MLRRREEVNDSLQNIWVQHLLLKISFFGSRFWKNRVLVAVILATWNPNFSKLCSCCDELEREMMEHYFFKGEVVNAVWKYFSIAVGTLGT